jgi:hypothetical protein
MKGQEMWRAFSRGVSISLVLVGANTAHAQTVAWHTVQLGYGIRLEVPQDWTTDREAVTNAIQGSQRVVDATALVVDETGHLITIAGPSFDSNEVSLSIEIMPTQISQATLARMSAADIRSGEENEFRPEAEAVAKRHGLRITAWNGTSRRMIGGRYGLLTSYRFRYPNGREVNKETYSVYLGSRSVNVHVFRRASADPRIVSALNRMLQSLVIAVDSL